MSKTDKRRYWLLALIILAGFFVLAVRLANLQVRGADDYGEENYSAIAEASMTKTIYEAGTRGQILDANGSLLAFDKKIYNVNFYRTPGSDQAQNGRYSKAIWEAIELLEAEGKEIKFEFWLAQDETGLWYFNTGTTDPSVAAAREKMFRGNFYVTSLPVDQIYERLCNNYLIHEIDAAFPADQKLTQEDKFKVLSVWQEMQMNAFNAVPIVLARDVTWSTVMEIETRMISMPGVSITVENQRIYPKNTLAAHILGYVGSMQTQSQLEEYRAKGYQTNDKIGLDGVEKTMEQWLTPNSSLRRGYRVVEADRAGKTIRELEYVAPKDGNTVKLTIDSSLQKVVETELQAVVEKVRLQEEAKLTDSTWLETNKEALLEYEAAERGINLAQNGAIVVLDMNARVQAMASYPYYDPNMFVQGMTSEERELLFVTDARNRLYNNAIGAADTPGSVFKMATGLAGLTEGVITVAEEISDGGYFTKYDKSNPPKCWIALNRVHQHANLNITGALTNSCNYYFYTVASRLDEIPGAASGERLYQFCAKLGLTTKTNIDLPGESKSVVGSQTSLYDPTRPITGSDQDTWFPAQVRTRIKNHLIAVGESYGISYAQERLDTCVKAIMDQSLVTQQGEDSTTWVSMIRQILQQELGMTRDMTFRAAVVGDIAIWLNDIKWGGSYSIQTGIGQAITTITPIAMARYIVAIANGGYVYDVQIIDSIIDPMGETIVSFDEPSLVNDLSGEIGQFLPYIREGMKGVTDDEGGTATSQFANFEVEIGGKTGTAEKSELDVESNAWFVCFAPYENPEIAIVVYVPQGLSGAQVSGAVKNIITHYLDSKVDESVLILPGPNALAQ
ncbi:MAG: hypothetical protein LBM74_01605 [Oscillospiraceae bacterium]|jgi:penicillin-binding protein 2|nr:hypothetical protein [Oscillospiraceae bacterium]